MMEHQCYVNGRMVPPSEAKVSIFDIGFMYGVTIYESLRTFQQQWYMLDKHWHRMEHSLEYAGLQGLLSKETYVDIMHRLLETNIGKVLPGDEIWANIQVTPGETFPMPLTKGASPSNASNATILAYSAEIPYESFVDAYSQGKHVVTGPFRSPPPQCYEQRMKNRSRFPHFLNKREAARLEPDAFALMLDIDGYITEGTGANIFFVNDGVLHTPTTRNILVGCSRQKVIELAERLDISVVERDITLYEAYTCQEAFWTTSSYCLLPISMIDGRQIGSTYPGPVAAELLEAWSREVGVDIVEHARKYADLRRKQTP